MNSTNWQRHTKSCKKRKSVLSTAKLSTFFKSSRNVSHKVETLVIETIDNVVCEQRKSDVQNYSDSIPNGDLIDSNLLTEIQATSYTNSVEPKDNTDSEQCVFDSIPNDDVIDSNLLTEIQATSYTNSVEPKDNTDSEQCVFDSIPNDDVIGSNLLTEIQATSYTNSVEPKVNTVSEQCVFDSIPDNDVIDSNLVNENLDKLCTTSVVSKDIIEFSSVNSTTENVSGSNVESYLNTISTIFENYPKYPALIPTSNISDEQFSFINSLGPCQPLQSSLHGKQFPKRMQGERLRSFHDEHYFKKLQDGSLVKRMWMSYSPSVDKVYCIACKLFGTSTAKKNSLAKDGINDWKHISRRILCHETSSDHLQAVLRKSMYNSNQRVDVGLILESSNAYVAENREVVKIIFETIIYLARLFKMIHPI